MQGARLGPYEILQPLGAGGMGEVYLAQDTRLGRRVAVKVLPPQFASDPERLARFEQEARAAAALNHPHIAAVFDVGAEAASDGTVTRFMVQEYLQGQSLREALEQGRLPLPRALQLGTEISEALSAAHRAGIVHRDVKPENVFVTQDGHAKVLDFGLAKLTEVAAGPMGSQSMSPTVLGTQAGAIMGTAGYMAPEQVQGLEVDHRADLFAFGCVLHEMVTGKQPFAGKNVYDTLSRIVGEEPPALDAAVPGAPAQLQWIVRKCLVKDPARRYQGAGDLVVDLAALTDDVKAGVARPARGSDAEATPTLLTRAPSTPLLAAGAVAALALGALATWAMLRPQPESRPVTRFDISIPEGRRLTTTTHPVAISPDGRNLVVLAVEGTERWLEVRRLDQLEAREIPGTRGVDGDPFFSPDGRSVAFTNSGGLMRVSLAGEPPQTIVRAESLEGATWTPDNRIIYSSGGVLYVVPAAGGEAAPLLPSGDTSGTMRYFWPATLPGQEKLLAANDDGVVLLSLETGEARQLVAGAAFARYSDGYLLYGRDGFVFAAPFDVQRAELTGEPIPLVEGVQAAPAPGPVHYAVSAEGTLVYSPSNAATESVQMILEFVDRSGVASDLPIGNRGQIRAASLSPDDRKVAAVLDGARDSTELDVYVYDVERGAGERLTRRGDVSRDVFWSPDGEWVIFGAGPVGDMDLYRQRPGVLGEAERLLQRPGDQVPSSVSPDGRSIAFTDGDSRSADIGILSLEDSSVEMVVASDLPEWGAEFSPDGRYLAYVQRDDVPNVFLLELATRRRGAVTAEGGVLPKWSRDGAELFTAFGGELFATPVDTGAEPATIGATARLFTRSVRNFLDTAADGRFLAARIDDARALDGRYQLEVVLNWPTEVAARRDAR